MAKVTAQREVKPIIVQIVNLAAAAETIEAKLSIVQIINPEAAAETIVQREAKPIIITQIVNPAVKAFIQDTGKLHLLLLKLFVLYLLIIIIFFWNNRYLINKKRLEEETRNLLIYCLHFAINQFNIISCLFYTRFYLGTANQQAGHRSDNKKRGIFHLIILQTYLMNFPKAKRENWKPFLNSVIKSYQVIQATVLAQIKLELASPLMKQKY